MQNKTDGPSLTAGGPEPRMEADHVKQLSVRVTVRGEVQGAMGITHMKEFMEFPRLRRLWIQYVRIRWLRQ